MAFTNETDALAWLCENLPRLRAAVGNRLHAERIVTEVRQGRRTARWARARLERAVARDPSFGLGDNAGDLLSLARLNLEPIAVTGVYVCPHDRCSRRGQPDCRGHEPLCHLAESSGPMRFDSQL